MSHEFKITPPLVAARAACVMLIEGQRPRELHWYHAAAMLFGDWGTSALNVLGLAFSQPRRPPSVHGGQLAVA